MLVFIVKSSARTDYGRFPVMYPDVSLLPCQKLGVITFLKDDFMLKLFNINH
jgi:hypothetical protein